MESVGFALLMVAGLWAAALQATPSPASTPAPAANSRQPQPNPAGYPLPDPTGYEVQPYPRSGTTDNFTPQEGKQTQLEVLENKAGDQIVRVKLHGVIFAVGVVPKADPLKGYLLLDPDCSHKMTVKQGLEVPLKAPRCALAATGK